MQLNGKSGWVCLVSEISLCCLIPGMFYYAYFPLCSGHRSLYYQPQILNTNFHLFLHVV